MNRIISFAVFIIVAVSIYFFLHYFVYKGIVRYIPLQPKIKGLIKYFFLFSGLTFPLSMIFSRILNLHLLNHYAFIWLGVISIAFGIMIVVRVLNLVLPGQAKMITLVSLGVVVLLSAYGLYNGLRVPVVKTLNLEISRLSPEMSGFKIVQLSDLHLNPYKSSKMVSRIVERVNRLKPDLIVITGDLIDGRIESDQDFFRDLKELKAGHGIVAIPGNHEYFEGITYFIELCRKLNFVVLRNQLKVINDQLQIIGVDDNEARRFSGSKPDLATPLKKCDPRKPIIVLRHRPEGFGRAADQGVDLQISGHTHDGQFPPMTFLVRLFIKYSFGLYTKNKAHIYTSCGTGFWGPPLRLLSRSEIVEFVLESRKVGTR
jgi:predicted MPP superfamily phosphohydrolase